MILKLFIPLNHFNFLLDNFIEIFCFFSKWFLNLSSLTFFVITTIMNLYTELKVYLKKLKNILLKFKFYELTSLH